MKTKMKLLSLAVVAIGFANGAEAKSLSAKDVMGVYKLTQFVSIDAHGVETPYCGGVHGTIAYLPGLVNVAINCETTTPGSNAEELGGKLFYSGPFEVDTATSEVIHRVRNYSHPSLNKVFRRKVEMPDQDHLNLVGLSASGGKIIIKWERIESFAYNNGEIPGVYQLVGSENEVAGSDEKVSFCAGFHGTIVYTPGGFNAVSINCGEKLDPNAVEPADMFGRKFFYAGTFTQQDKLLIHHLRNASEVNQIGTDSLRDMELNGEILSLAGVNGSKFVAKWRKFQSFVGFKK